MKKEIKVGQVWINKAGRRVTIERMDTSEDGSISFDGREEGDQDEEPWAYEPDGTLCGFPDSEPETLATLLSDQNARQEAIDAATRKLVEACEIVVSTNEPCDERMAEMQRIAKLNNLRAALAELKEASK